MVKLPASNKQLVSLVMQRWRTERTYQDLKGELGLDHYEGRSYPGWHHHISVVLACYAFVVAERARRFPPSTRGAPPDPQDGLAAGETLSRQLHHCPACGGPHHRHLDSAVSDLPSEKSDESASEKAQGEGLTQ